MEYSCIRTDVLIIGSGLAGLRAAVAAAEKGARVVICAKGGGASHEVMGFNAVVNANDSIEAYYDDIVRSGKGIARKALAMRLAKDSGAAVRYLEKLGFSFDQHADNSYDTIATLGSSAPRLVHKGSTSGAAIMKMLRQKCNDLGVKWSVGTVIVDLLLSAQGVCGAWGTGPDDQGPLVFLAKSVVLATGGSSGMHQVSTYPKSITGDGYAMAFRAGAELIDMEFVQFEPCCYVYPEKLRGGLAVTTMLLEGGELRNNRGETFMKSKGRPGYRVQKNELARYIMGEILAGRGTAHQGVFYDITSLPPRRIQVDHEIFYRPALEGGIDLTKEMAEVAPAAHTCLGGIAIDSSGAAGLAGLYAAGEVAGGIHGANRIGGCAGAETLVYGAAAGDAAAEYALVQRENIELPDTDGAAKIAKYYKRLSQKGKVTVEHASRDFSRLVTERLGIFKNKPGLTALLDDIDEHEQLLELCEIDAVGSYLEWQRLLNMITVAKLQTTAALLRQESRGVFVRDDFPETDVINWDKSISQRKMGDAIRVDYIAGDKE